MKKIIWVIGPVLAIIVGFVIGKNSYKKKDNLDNIVLNKNTIEIQQDNTVEVIKNKEILTSMPTVKVSINTEIIEQIHYKECDHIIETTVKNIDKYINMDSEDIEKRFPEMEIKEFTSEKLVLYQEEKDCCNEHFLIKDVDGFVTIYTLNSMDNVLEILDTTEIETAYLTDEDRNNLKNGIKVYTKQNLNKVIEDFE